MLLSILSVFTIVIGWKSGKRYCWNKVGKPTGAPLPLNLEGTR